MLSRVLYVVTDFDYKVKLGLDHYLGNLQSNQVFFPLAMGIVYLQMTS